MKASLGRWLSVLGMDFHVATTLLMRGWTILAGGVMVLAIPATLSPQQQGYYFTFSSLLGLQVFFELGLNQVITQITSKEMALHERGRGQDGNRHLLRVRSTLAMLRRWYRIAAVLFFVITGLAGAALFRNEGSLPATEWLGPWVGLAIFTAINLYFSPLLAVTEGCGQVGQVARLRLGQSIIGFLMTWACLFSGAGLWAIPINTLVASVWTSRWLRSKDHVLRMFGDVAQSSQEHAIDWRKEVLPFQWRIAVSWMSGYLMYQLFTPLTFIHLGATAAGRLGLTIAIFTAIQSLGVSWFNARIPLITGLISRGDRVELDRLFKATFVRATTLTLVGCACVVLGVSLSLHFGLPQASRLIDMPTLLAIAVGTVGNTAIYGAATYMRAHGKEPMLPVSVTAAVLTLTAAYFASKLGTFPTMLSQTVITMVVVLPWTARLFTCYYAKPH
ncbi:MAG: hypothetical protein QM639_06860 [Rhodocyclaceae bacterium]